MRCLYKGIIGKLFFLSESKFVTRSVLPNCFPFQPRRINTIKLDATAECKLRRNKTALSPVTKTVLVYTIGILNKKDERLCFKTNFSIAVSMTNTFNIITISEKAKRYKSLLR